MRYRVRGNLPVRELVFVQSLMYHGYRYTRRRNDLKKRKGYIIPSTVREDSGGVDFWIKMPGAMELVPVQVTQRGNRIYRERHPHHTSEQLAAFIAASNQRIGKKQRMCRRYKIAFVLVRDYTGPSTNTTIAWGDIKALRYGLAHLRS